METRKTDEGTKLRRKCNEKGGNMGEMKDCLNWRKKSDREN